LEVRNILITHKCGEGFPLIGVRESVPGAVATGLRLAGIEIAGNCYPVATAPGTDLIRLESVRLRASETAM